MRRAVVVLALLATPSLALAGPDHGWVAAGGGFVAGHRGLSADGTVDLGVTLVGTDRVALAAHTQVAYGLVGIAPPESPPEAQRDVRLGLVATVCTQRGGACGLLGVDAGVEHVDRLWAVMDVGRIGAELGDPRWRVRATFGVRRSTVVDGADGNDPDQTGSELLLLGVRRF